MSDILTLTRPDDWHLHLRDEAALKTLQAVALEQGFRTGDTDAFAASAQKAGLAVDVNLKQVIDPPGFDLMFEMIDIVSREMNQ